MAADTQQFLYRLAVLVCIALIVILILYYSIHSPDGTGGLRYLYMIQFGIDIAIFYMMAESWLWGKETHGH